jgi:phage shock protein E
MKKYLKLFIVVSMALFTIGVVSSCSNAPTVDLKNYSEVIDVRTPQEFATGHLQGALNIDIEAPTFADQVGRLDKAKNYFIYCHSGNRAGQAITDMSRDGFSGTLTNGGAIEDASSATGLAIVQN